MSKESIMHARALIAMLLAVTTAGCGPAPPPPSPEELEQQREMDDYADVDFNFKDDAE